AKGVQFMADNAAPYHFHCLEGKDRAGYMAVFLESLMGATKEEIIDDYMKSYENYYKVTKDSKQYEYIKNDVITMMESIAGGKDLSVEKLTKGAEDMLLANGVKAEDIAKLKEKLSGSKTAFVDGFKVAA
ncbi:MAG: tyrosine-protein phosphatase, partial [Catonella sp.]|uniref:tyrosine-protein phosphatase n=1 Tax=Catonella sp. TaxID=2382125 RepID=UPI003FA02FAA